MSKPYLLPPKVGCITHVIIVNCYKIRCVPCLSNESLKGKICVAFAEIIPYNLFGCGPWRQRMSICSFKLNSQEVNLREEKEKRRKCWLEVDQLS